jgi:predicted aminopeptidase
MVPEARRHPHCLRALRLLLVAVAGLAASGCYLARISEGHMTLMIARQPIGDVLADPGTPPELRERLEYVREARAFASYALALPDNGSFTTYVELDRPYVAWNVFAAPEFSVEPKKWCFVVAGCVNYRGYFSEQEAVDFARQLEGKGFDVYVSPVAAYSTLGTFNDPVLSSMLDYDDVTLAGLIFHEMAHQVAYVPGDSDFNEAFAQSVEMEGVKRWLDSLGRYDELVRYRQAKDRLFAVIRLIEETRRRLAEVYASGTGRVAMREAKARELQRLKDDYARLRESWPDGPDYDRWMASEFNNARLAATSTYDRCLPGFTRLLQDLDGYLQGYYRAVRRLGRQGAEEREAAVCREPSAMGAAAEPVVFVPASLEPEVAGHDRP